MLKGYLYGNSGEKDAEGNNVYLLLVPKLFFTYMASAFGLDKGFFRI
jgi:hypothetical protein